MAYSSENLQLVAAGMSNTNNNCWFLNTTDPVATVNTSGYISDGVAKGMKQGDDVTVVVRASLPLGDVSAKSLCFVQSLEADGSVDLTDGLTITATDTD